MMTNSASLSKGQAGHMATGRLAARRFAAAPPRCSIRLATATHPKITPPSSYRHLSSGPAACIAAKRSRYCSFIGLPVPFHSSSDIAVRSKKSSPYAQLSATATDAAPASTISSGQSLTAVVVGSGMAGLATAAALSDHVDKVVLLEADAPKDSWHQSLMTTEQEHHTRPGVGQYQLLHVLLARGAAELERLVPGYINTLLDRGAVRSDFLTQSLFAFPAGPFVPVHNSQQPLQMIQASRHLLEQTLRDMVSLNPKVTFSYHTRVDGLVFSGTADDATPHPTAAAAAAIDAAGGMKTAVGSSSSSKGDHQRVTGVLLSDGSVMSADLVVVASGRRGEVAEWLSSAGWPEPSVSKTSANCRYVCWLMQMSPDVIAQLPYSGVFYQMQPPYHDTGAYTQQIEEGTWIATVGTFDNKGPKPDVDDVLRYIKEVPYLHDVYELFKQGSTASSVHSFGRLNNIWRHYENVLPPEGLLILGDAYCTFNPIDGQGMTVAALEAGIIHSILEQQHNKETAAPAPTAAGAGAAEGDNVKFSSSSSSGAARVSRLAADFYPAAAEVVGASWLFAALRDLQYPFATAENQELTWIDRMTLAYVDVICKVATFDPETSEAFCRALHMLDPPSAMFKPSMVAKALAHQLLGWPWGLPAVQRPKTLAPEGSPVLNPTPEPSFKHQ